MTTGKWAQPGVPHRGWTCIGMEDLEEPAMTRDWWLGWIVMPGVVTAVLIVGALWLANRE